MASCSMPGSSWRDASEAMKMVAEVPRMFIASTSVARACGVVRGPLEVHSESSEPDWRRCESCCRDQVLQDKVKRGVIVNTSRRRPDVAPEKV